MAGVAGDVDVGRDVSDTGEGVLGGGAEGVAGVIEALVALVAVGLVAVVPEGSGGRGQRRWAAVDLDLADVLGEGVAGEGAGGGVDGAGAFGQAGGAGGQGWGGGWAVVVGLGAAVAGPSRWLPAGVLG